MNEDWTKGMCAGAKLSARSTKFSELERLVAEISEAMKVMKASGVRESELFILIQRNCKSVRTTCYGRAVYNKPTQKQIKSVVNGMMTLSDYLFPRTKMEEDKKKAIEEDKKHE